MAKIATFRIAAEAGSLPEACSPPMNKCDYSSKAGPASVEILEAFAQGQDSLSLVEARIKSRLDSSAPHLTEISNYLLSLGGKRIRPFLALLTNRLFGHQKPSQALIDVAAGIELIHMATLLHDDIIDESPLRRHQSSAFSKFGSTPTLLTGDFLLVRAFGLCAHLDDFVITSTEKACVELTEGEILEGVISSDSPRDIDEYINIVGKKTASLFALAAEMGAYLAEVDASSVKSIRNYGYNAGIAFQMIDDILDITADENLLGKPSGTDLRQKTPSLVNILWLETKDPKAIEFFSKTSISEQESFEATEYLRLSSVIDHCKSLARTYANHANTALHEVSEDKLNIAVRSQLSSLIEYTLSRCL